LTSFLDWGKRVAEKLARRLGYVVLPAWHNNIIIPPSQEYTFHAAKHLHRLFPRLGIDCVIDVGANAGQYCSFLREEVGYIGWIFSFEPNPSLARLLEDKSRHDPKWSVEGCALGGTPGRLKFNIMADSEFSSFLAPRHEEVMLFREKNRVQEQVEVDVKTLDMVVPKLQERYGVKGIYLKLDTQGFDLEVLRGASNSLNQINALQFEAAIRKIYDNMPRYDEVIKYCEHRGFIISGIFPNNQGHFPILVEFDCYLVRESVVLISEGDRQ
jgi:FkbM family methyltransferase